MGSEDEELLDTNLDPELESYAVFDGTSALAGLRGPEQDDVDLPKRGTARLRDIKSDLEGRLVSRRDLKKAEGAAGGGKPAADLENALDSMLSGLVDGPEAQPMDGSSDGEDEGMLGDLMQKKHSDLDRALGALAQAKPPTAPLLLVREKRNLEAKSQAVKFQRRVFTQVLDFRIRLQRPLLAARALPGPDDPPITSESRKRKVDEAYDVCVDLLDELESIEDKLQTMDSTREPPKKRQKTDARPSLDEAWTRVHGDWGFLQDAYEELELWHRKTALQAASNLKQHKAMKQSGGFVARVEEMMEEDYARVLRRSRSATAEDENLTESQRSQIYDDRALYSNLLRTLADSDPMKERALAEAAKSSKRKKKKKVKTKQRTLKYTVIPKLLNFTVPNGRSYGGVEATGFPVEVFYKSLFNS